MERRIFAKTGEPVSLLGFGAMRFPTLGGRAGSIDPKRAGEMIDLAFEKGVNYFDTAYIYHDGESESYLGRALSGRPRDSYLLATKMPPWRLKTANDVRRIFDEQLKRCRTDYFDFYLLHNVSVSTLPTFEKLGVYDILRERQREGKIRQLGFSFHDLPGLLDRVTDDYEWDFAQIQLNYLDWEMQKAKEQYEILHRKNIPVVVMEPIRGGTLASLPEECERILKAANPGGSIASWAMRFAAGLPGVLTVLSGMSTLEQVRDNIATMTPFVPLSADESKALDNALDAFRKVSRIPCTNCRYCSDCPSGVDIPQMISIYNFYIRDKNASHFLGNYENLRESALASNCTACGQCEQHCPQGIVIHQWMEKITDTVNRLRNNA